MMITRVITYSLLLMFLVACDDHGLSTVEVERADHMCKSLGQRLVAIKNNRTYPAVFHDVHCSETLFEGVKL